MATAKDAHSLTSYFEKQYKKIYGQEPNVNRVTARWNFDSILKSMTVPQVMDLLDYYFTTPKTRLHDLEWFFYNYDKLIKGKQEADADKEHRRKLMEESKIRAEQWRASGRQSITDD